MAHPRQELSRVFALLSLGRDQALLGNLAYGDYYCDICCRLLVLRLRRSIALTGVAHRLVRRAELLPGHVDQLLVALALQDEAHLEVFFAEFGGRLHWRAALRLVGLAVRCEAHLGSHHLLLLLMLLVVVALAVRHWDMGLGGVQIGDADR